MRKAFFPLIACLVLLGSCTDDGCLICTQDQFCLECQSASGLSEACFASEMQRDSARIIRESQGQNCGEFEQTDRQRACAFGRFVTPDEAAQTWRAIGYTCN